MRRYALVATCLLAGLLATAPALAQPVVINNGDAPPNPANVIDAANSYPSDSVLVQNSGCDFNADGSPFCQTGDSTAVELVDGGIVGGDFSVSPGSEIIVSGGRAESSVRANGRSDISIHGGSVANDVVLDFNSELTMTGGSVEGDVTTGVFAMDWRMTITGGSIAGDLNDRGEGGIVMSDTALGGSLISPADTGITVADSTIGGDVFVGIYSQLTVTGTPIAGSLTTDQQILAVSLSEGTTIGGDLTIQGFDGGTTTMRGGSIGGSVFLERAFSTHELNALVLRDVAVAGGLNATDLLTVRVRGGSLGLGVSAAGSILELSGLDIEQDILASALARVTMLGGSVGGDVVATDSAEVSLNAPGGGDIRAFDSSTIVIFGRSFAIDGVPVGQGPITATSGLLTGDFNGIPLSYDFLRDPTATLELIPEPSTGLLLAIGLAGLSARRRAGSARH